MLWEFSTRAHISPITIAFLKLPKENNSFRPDYTSLHRLLELNPYSLYLKSRIQLQLRFCIHLVYSPMNFRPKCGILVWYFDLPIYKPQKRKYSFGAVIFPLFHSSGSHFLGNPQNLQFCNEIISCILNVFNKT